MRLGKAYRSRIVYAGLLLGVVIGLAGAEVAARFLRLWDGQRRLAGYAQQLQRAALQVDREGEQAILTVLADKLNFCSPEELRLMRGIVYNSQEVKDIGRIRNGAFVCSSEVGVLPKPIPMPPVKESFRSSLFYGWTPVMFGEENKGFVVQVKDVDIVLNPRAFETFERQSRSYAAYVYDSPSQRLIQGFGAVMPLTKEEIIASKVVKRGGFYYEPVCAAQSHVCVVASDSEKAMLAANEPLHRVLLVAGVSIGEALALGFLLLYQRHQSQAKQLRRAVRRDDLGVVYQPIVDLTSRAVVGLEALARWTNEDGEVVPPDVFIALAEQSQFVVEITRVVVRRGLRELGDELRAGRVRLTVNITGQDLSDPEFLPFLQGALHAAGVPASQLGLELTERSATDQIEAIAKLRQAGHVVYIDDFGTGYSSLAYLVDLDVDAIKIDRAFTASIGTGSITESILPQVIQMAQQLRLAVVVEGIETAEQARYFEDGRHAGTLGQGWLFGKPMPAVQVRCLLKAAVEVPA